MTTLVENDEKRVSRKNWKTKNLCVSGFASKNNDFRIKRLGRWEGSRETGSYTLINRNVCIDF